jgi:hypothetical protein
MDPSGHNRWKPLANGTTPCCPTWQFLRSMNIEKACRNGRAMTPSLTGAGLRSSGAAQSRGGLFENVLITADVATENRLRDHPHLRAIDSAEKCGSTRQPGLETASRGSPR